MLVLLVSMSLASYIAVGIEGQGKRWSCKAPNARSCRIVKDVILKIILMGYKGVQMNRKMKFGAKEVM